MRDNYLYRVAKSLPLMRKTFIEAYGAWPFRCGSSVSSAYAEDFH